MLLLETTWCIAHCAGFYLHYLRVEVLHLDPIHHMQCWWQDPLLCCMQPALVLERTREAAWEAHSSRHLHHHGLPLEAQAQVHLVVIVNLAVHESVVHQSQQDS